MHEKPSKAPLIAFTIAGLALIILVVYWFVNYDSSMHSGRILSDLTRMEEKMKPVEDKVDEFLYGTVQPTP